MSVESWKAEFYPVGASHPSVQKDDIARLDHSILKWTGFLPENMKKHEVEKRRGFTYVHSSIDQCDLIFRTNSASCALCVQYAHDDMNTADICNNCPLARSLGTDCDSSHGPWCVFVDNNDPKPMLEALKKAREMVLAEQKQDS